MLSPCLARTEKMISSAAMPEATSRAPIPPSSAATRFSTTSTVGLEIRE